MGKDYKHYVLTLLETSPSRLRHMEIMWYELHKIPQISSLEMIEVMSFQPPNNALERTYPKNVPEIALSYQSTTQRINEETAKEILDAYMNLYHEQHRLIHYISLLSENQQRVLHLYYFQSCTWMTVAKSLNTTVRTAQRIRQQAIEDLANLYAYAESLFTL